MPIITDLYEAILKLIRTLLEMFGADTGKFDELFGDDNKEETPVE